MCAVCGGAGQAEGDRKWRLESRSDGTNAALA